MPFKDKEYNKIYQRRLMRKRSLQRKMAIIAGLGGKCRNCNYDTCAKALEAHHINPDDKDFNLAHLKGASKDRVKKETQKTILLCANCHREVETCGLDISHINIIFLEDKFEETWNKYK